MKWRRVLLLATAKIVKRIISITELVVVWSVLQYLHMYSKSKVLVATVTHATPYAFAS